MSKWLLQHLNSLPANFKNPRNFLIYGKPQTGKTQLIRDLYWRFVEQEDFEPRGWITGDLKKLDPEFDDGMVPPGSKYVKQPPDTGKLSILTLNEERRARGVIQGLNCTGENLFAPGDRYVKLAMDELNSTTSNLFLIDEIGERQKQTPVL